MVHVQRVDPEKTQRLVRVRYVATGAEVLRDESEAALLERQGVVVRVMQTAMKTNGCVER